MAVDHVETTLATDIFLVGDAMAFLDTLDDLVGAADALLDRLAGVIAEGGSPRGTNMAMRGWVIEQLADAAERSETPVGELDATQVVGDGLRDRYAELAACIDPAIGGGALTLRSAALLRAFIASAAEAVGGPFDEPAAWTDVELAGNDVFALGTPLLATSVAGCSPFRFVTSEAPLEGLSPRCRSIVGTLLSIADGRGVGASCAIVVAPRLDTVSDMILAAASEF